MTRVVEKSPAIKPVSLNMGASCLVVFAVIFVERIMGFEWGGTLGALRRGVTTLRQFHDLRPQMWQTSG